MINFDDYYFVQCYEEAHIPTDLIPIHRRVSRSGGIPTDDSYTLCGLIPKEHASILVLTGVTNHLTHLVPINRLGEYGCGIVYHDNKYWIYHLRHIRHDTMKFLDPRDPSINTLVQN